MKCVPLRWLLCIFREKKEGSEKRYTKLMFYKDLFFKRYK